MSSFLRQLGSRLQTSSSARYVLYGAAAAGTTAVTWRYHAQSRNEQLQRRNAARTAHAHINHDIVSPDKEAKRDDGAIVEAFTPATADGEDGEGEEAGNTGAFDPVTGEINWDCPCLGGMAHGPCGQQFRLAFSCFVYSEAEPKGMDCVEKFKDMQDCFREHPEIYAEELADDGEEDDREGPVSSTTPPPEAPPWSGGAGVEIPHPDGESEPKPTGDDLKLPGGAPPPTPQPKPPITPPPLPPADPKPPTISDPPADPLPPPTIIDPPAGPVRGGIASTHRRNPPRAQPPRE